jgi:UDP-N-acetylmuramoyl-L-alanyl-D-glutamate--2,6-diaminopimelate ligase
MQSLKNIYHLLTAILANIIYGFPSRHLTVIGVTGTDGKTTTTCLIHHILQSNGKKTAMISTVGASINNKMYDIGFHVTTPSPFGIQRYIRQAVDSGHVYLVLETTSHALDQFRVWGVKYDIGVLTNITHEHLDYHKTYDMYLSTKLKLLQQSNISIVNMDDSSYKTIHTSLTKIYATTKKNIVLAKSEGNLIITYSLTNQNADITLKKFPFTTHLIGAFNKQNCLAAIAATHQVGISNDAIRQAILTFQAPIGRQEVVYNKDFRVIIDFAHTPNALEKILPEVKQTSGKLIHVFGSAGLRDRSKRPLMGKAADKYDDIIILTAEDPRSENVQDICGQIAQGITKKYTTIPDRKKAIQYAISIAQKNDTVLITGKGHEKSINYGHGEESWNEFRIVRDALKL